MSRPVNQRQLAVLRWIGDGCPAGIMEDSTYKTTAIALKNRGLTKVSKRGGWHAELTDAGRFYLENGRYPDEKKQAPRLPSKTQREAKQPEPPQPEPLVVENTPVLAAVATPAPKVQRVVVPQRLVNPHPLVAELRESRRGIDVSKSLVPRALRIIQGLVVAFETEGWTVTSAAKTRTRWGHEWDRKDLLVVDTGELREGIRIGEENDRVPHVPTAYELKQKERWSYTRIPEYDYHLSGRIYLEISTHYNGRRHRWSDRKRWSVEEKLDQLLDELQERSDIEREKRLERERKEAEWQVQVDLAVAEAKALLRESHRRDVLLAQAETWNRVEGIRRYLEAMRARISGISDPESRERAEQWLSWCERCVEPMDPLNDSIGFPEEPEATPQALEPFLPRWASRRAVW